MASEVISTRVNRDFYRSLTAYAQEKGIFLSDVFKLALVNWFETNKDLPDALVGALKRDQADVVLKLKMSRTLFLHNVRQKFRRILGKEDLHKDQREQVIKQLFEGFITNASDKGWDFEKEYLKTMLKKAEGDAKDKIDFAYWVGLIKNSSLELK